MKTKEELLKIYSAYLPYGLEISTDDDGEDWTETVIGLNNEALETNVGNYWDYTVKPILYSMEMLTQEIEHNGEKFVPCVKIGLRDCFPVVGNTIRNQYGYEFEVTKLSYDKVQKLLEWKFNIFNLSDDEYIKL